MIRPVNTYRLTMALAVLSLACSMGVRAADKPASGAPSLPSSALAPLEIEAARADLASTDWILRARALTVLSDGHVEAAIPAIETLFASADAPWVRGRALVALARLRGNAVLAEAKKNARNPEASLRAAALEALGIIGDRQAAADVQADLKDSEIEVRGAALVAYARLTGEEAWATIGAALAGSDVSMIRAATRALAYIPTDAARRKMLDLLEHDDDAVRVEAAASLLQVRYAPAITPLLRHYASDNYGQARLQCRKALQAYEPRALVDPLLAVLKGDDPALYDAALRSLEFCASPRLFDEVAATFRSSDARYAKSLPLALQLLAEADADRYHDFFLEYIRSADATVRAQAVKSLARCRKIDHFSTLRPLLADQDAGVVLAALLSLRRFTKGAPSGGIVAYLAEPLKSADPQVSEAALALLEDRLASTESDKARSALARFLSGPDANLRLHAAGALAVYADDDARNAIARLQGYVTDWSVAGPFPNDARNAGMAALYPPEQSVNLEKAYALADVSTTQPAAAQGFLAQVKALKAAWTAFQVKQANGRFSLNDVPFPAGGNVLYFYASFQLADGKPVTLRLPPLPSDAALEKFTVWLNDQKLELPKPPPRAPQTSRREKDTADKDMPLEVALPATLAKGANHVLIKTAVENADVGNWSYFVRLVDADGKPVEALKFKPVN